MRIQVAQTIRSREGQNPIADDYNIHPSILDEITETGIELRPMNSMRERG